MTKADEDAAGVAYKPGLWAWVVQRPRNVPCVPVVGRLGFFEVPDPRRA